MSSEAIVRLFRVDHVDELARQLASRAPAPARLITLCSEARRRSPGRFERAYAEDLHLRTPGGALDDAESEAALRFAIDEAGIQEIVCVLHTDCAQAGPPAPPESRGDFMDRIHAGARRHQAELRAGRERLRKHTDAIRGLAGPGVRVLGVLEVGEGGPLLGYVAEEDRFEEI